MFKYEIEKRRRRKTKGNGKERGEMVKKKKKGTRFTIHINNKGTRFTIHMRKEELKMKILHCLYIYIYKRNTVMFFKTF